MNGFIKKSVGTLTLGEKLKKLRSERRASLRDVSNFTKIQTRYLECLEEGRYNELPADVYIKGFLKSYADFFGLDEKILIRLYEKERGIENNLTKSKSKKKEGMKPLSVSFISFTPKKLALFIVSFLAIAVVIFIYKELGSFAESPQLAILSPENNSETDSNSIAISGITEKDARLFINGQPILVNEEGNFLETLTLQPGSNTIKVKTVNRFNKETEESVVVNFRIPEEDLVSEESGDGKSAEKENEELVLELSVDPGPVWLNVEADGNLVFNGTMLSGASQIFKAGENFSVSSGKGDATFVKFNGEEKGKLSEEPGAARGIIFDKNNNY